MDKKNIKKFSVNIYNAINKNNLKEDDVFCIFYWIVILKFIYFNPCFLNNMKNHVTLNFNKIILKHDKKQFVRFSQIIHNRYPKYFYKPLELFMINHMDLELVLDIDKISFEHWNKPEIIGWIYQYFIPLFSTNINAKTQIFTPKWLVKFIVQNTLCQGLDENKLNIKLNYKINRLNNIVNPDFIENKTILDPACGTGNILSYCIELIYDYYFKLGYTKKQSIKCICDSLYGLDIDYKVVAIAKTIITFKILNIDENFLNYNLNLNIYAINDKISNKDNSNYIINEFGRKLQYGSLIKSTYKKIKEKHIIHKLFNIINNKYDFIITNPPFLSTRNMPNDLRVYLKENYKGYHKDLFAAFIKRCMDFGHEDSYIGLITPFVWMFLSSYEEVRDEIINKKTILALAQLEYSSFEDATVPLCSFILKNKKEELIGKYIRLSQYKGEKNQDIGLLKGVKEKTDYTYEVDQKKFLKIPKKNIAYWVEDKMVDMFVKNPRLGEIAACKVGLQTSDNKRFIRYWHEVDFNNIGFHIKDRDHAKKSNKKWFPYNKGGNFRKWYGNLVHVVNWHNDGEEIRHYNSYLNESRASNIGIANTQYYFKEGITWSFVNSTYFGARINPPGYIFDTAGSCIFLDDDIAHYVIAFLCSKVCHSILEIINPTLNFQPKDISKIPMSIYNKNKVDILAKKAIDICREDWLEREIFWEYKRNPLLNYNEKNLDICCENYLQDRFKKIKELKNAEETINKLFINTYNLNMDHKITDCQITLQMHDKYTLIVDVISYLIGCIMGRYDLNKEGLAFAGGQFSLNKYSVKPYKYEIIEKKHLFNELLNIIKRAFGKENYEVNIKTIGSVLGYNADYKANIKTYIDRYFYIDHLKKYKKRPIYFNIVSGKNKDFDGFMYIHRFNKNTFDNFIERIDNRHSTREMELFIEKIEKIKNVHIDLDEGINHIYNKFKDILKKI